MSWPDVDRRVIRRFILRMGLTRRTADRYRRLLESFQQVVERYSCAELPTQVSPLMLAEWLRERRCSAAEATLLHRAYQVDRFLDFLAAERLIDANPFAALRTQYGLRGAATIVRALLSADPQQALACAGRRPRYGSFLGTFLKSHVDLMRAVGKKFTTQEGRILRFDHFLQGRLDLASRGPAVLLRAWQDAYPTPSHVHQCQLLQNDLAVAWRRLDPDVELPRPDPKLGRRIPQRAPYPYSADEVERLLATAKSFRSPGAPLRPRTLYTMIVLAYCCGLRLGELLRLNLGDVNLDAGEITVSNTKFFKSRLLPVSPSVFQALKAYASARQSAGGPSDTASAFFWHTQAAGRYSPTMAGKLLTQVIRRTGLKPDGGRIGPRVHDLRHAFAVNRVLGWYRDGVDVQSKLTHLATYMGHKRIESTVVYLTATSELLETASERFRAYACRRALSAGKGAAS